MLDNVSTDGSLDFVKEHFPDVKITIAPYNTGTAKGSNLGFRETTGDYVIFQSNDLILDRHCIEELVKMLDENPYIGICTSVLVKYAKNEHTKKHHIDNAGGIMDMFGFGMQKYPDELMEKIPEKEEVFYSYGGSFIIRRELFEKIGGFDDRYFTLNDDIDLSWRVRLLGYKVFYTKKSWVFHKVSATLKRRNRAQIRFWAERNSIRTFIKDASLYDLVTMMPLYITLLSGQMGYFLIRGKVSYFFSDIKSILWNLWYLPETLFKRYKIQSLKKKNNIREMIVPTSFKLRLFNSFRKSL
jgi:GT2 family glycosyltransferase